MGPNYKLRLLIAVAVCGVVYWVGLPYVLLGNRDGIHCDYYGLQGHRSIAADYANCPMVKVWELRYPVLAWYDGDTMEHAPNAPAGPIRSWVNKPRW